MCNCHQGTTAGIDDGRQALSSERMLRAMLAGGKGTVMRSEATRVDEYLDELPEDRRLLIQAIRRVILANLPAGYEEVMAWGMITYEVPLAVYADTYNGKPLMYAALASQKHHIALYLTSIYMDEASRASFERTYRATGKRFDVGKSCVRFRTLDDLPLDLIAETIAATPVAEFVAKAKAARKT